MSKYVIQWNEEKAKKPTNVRTWDVRISLNKAGRNDGKMVIRFGFLNKAVKVFKGKNYIEMSKIKDNRIYFRLFDNKANSNTTKLCANKAKNPGLYTAFTPSDEQNKLYRARWINGTFNLLYDEDNQLYYIENTIA